MLRVSDLGSRLRCGLGTGWVLSGSQPGGFLRVQISSGSTQVPDTRNSDPSSTSRLHETLDKSILSLSLSHSGWLGGVLYWTAPLSSCETG